MLHCVVFFQLANNIGNTRNFLSDRDVNALDIRSFLIDDGIECDRSLAGLPVTDDQLALPAADRNHRIN